MTGRMRRTAILGIRAAIMVMGLGMRSAFAADASAPESGEAIFIVQIIVLLVCGRLLSEAMQRIGQPAVTGQLIAGI